MRQFSLSNKKPRGIPRRIRSLERWANQFREWFPEGLQTEDRYCSWKIPVLRNLVEGRHTTKEIQAKCAQLLIDACHHLIRAKPISAEHFRVTCVVCLPDMFSSEICIYLQEEYFRSRTDPNHDPYGCSTPITDRSLAKKWSLHIPPGMNEYGVAIDYRDTKDKEDCFLGTRWYFGELQPRS